jgi:hypothetical protein
MRLFKRFSRPTTRFKGNSGLKANYLFSKLLLAKMSKNNIIPFFVYFPYKFQLISIRIRFT